MACHVGNQAEMVTAFHDFKKNAQHERCELSFIWGKMRTAAQETAPQTAQRDCSKAAGEVSIYMIVVKGEYVQ